MNEYIMRSDIINDLLESADGVKSTPSWHDLFMELVERYKEFPAADVAPVVHGKWKEENPDYLDGDSVYICSICGETWNLEAGTPKENNMNYCPNCGAKMDL